MSLIIAAGCAFLPMLMFFGYIVDQRDIKWSSYVQTTEMAMHLLLSIVLFSVITAYIFTREYSDKTAGILYAYPISRFSIFIGKLIVVYLIILFVYAVHFLLTIGGASIVRQELPSPDFFVAHLKVHVISALLQFMLIPLIIFIANLSKAVLIPIVYSSLGAVSNIIFMQSDYYKYSPFMLPGMPVMQVMGETVDIQVMLIIGSIIFLLGISGNIYHYITADFQ